MTIIARNLKKDGIEISFDGRQPEEVKTWLSSNRFRWSKFSNLYWKRYNEKDWILVHSYFDIPLPEAAIATNPELPIGITIEKEHTDNPVIAEKIAIDHLKENPNYYSEPKPVNWAEKELKKENTMKINDPMLNRLLSAYIAQPDAFDRKSLIESFVYDLAGPKLVGLRQSYLQKLTGASKRPPKAKAGIGVLETEIKKWIASQETQTLAPKTELGIKPAIPATETVLKVVNDNKPLMNTIIEKAEPFLKEIMVHYERDFEKQFKRTMSEYDKEITRLSLLYDLVKAINVYTKPTDKLISANFNTGYTGGFEIKSRIERDGQLYHFNTEAIIAGGHNIQREHLRYITDTNLPKTNNTEESDKFKIKIQNLSKKQKIEAEIESYKKRIIDTNQKIEQASKLTDQEIVELKIPESTRNVTWEQIVERGANENYDNDKSKFEESQKKYKDGVIKSYKDINIVYAKENIQSLTKSMNKLEGKLAELKAAPTSQEFQIGFDPKTKEQGKTMIRVIDFKRTDHASSGTSVTNLDFEFQGKYYHYTYNSGRGWGTAFITEFETEKQLEDRLLHDGKMIYSTSEPKLNTALGSFLQIIASDKAAELKTESKQAPGTIRPDFMNKNVLKGREIQLFMPNGEKRNALFAIVELDNIVASHNEENFHSEPLYPKNASGNNINDRNYSGDLSAQKAVMDYARELKPERLITTSRTPSGTPIITKDGFVVSGNNRTMSLKLAAKQYPNNYQAYVKFLGEEIESFRFPALKFNSFSVGGGIKGYIVSNPKEINELPLSFNHPVLVRIDLDFPSYTTQELAKYNKDTKKSERPIDKAKKLSNILRDNSRCADIIASTVGEYETFSEFYVNIAGQKQLAKTLVDCNLFTEQELPAYFSGTTFTEAGKEFIETLLAALILDTEALEMTDQPGVKSTRQKLITALPVLMKNASLPEGSLKQKINDAVILQYNMKGSNFADFIRQRTMFGTLYDKQAVYLNRLIDSGKIKFKQAIEGYNDAVMANQGASLFGEKPSLDEIFNHWIVGGVSESDRKLIEGSDMVGKGDFKLTPEQKAVIQPEWDKMQAFLKEPQISKSELRSQDGFKIMLVDGEQVRKTHIQFTMGGHGYVYEWIPKDEIWIDENLYEKTEDMEATIKHELFEVKKMRDEGLSYEDAHELANAMEEKERNANNEIFYTTAPESYDGFGTKTESITEYTNNASGKTYRRVWVGKKNIEWQKQRNNSGGYELLTEEEFKKFDSLYKIYPVEKEVRNDEPVLTTDNDYADYVINETEKRFNERFPGQNFEKAGIVKSWIDTAKEKSESRANSGIEDIFKSYLPLSVWSETLNILKTGFEKSTSQQVNKQTETNYLIEGQSGIQPKEISLHIRNAQTNYVYDSFNDANKGMRDLLDNKSFSDLEYDIIYKDGETLSGVIDCEPRSFFANEQYPLSRHLKTFWGNVAKASIGIYSPDDIAFAQKIYQNYNLGKTKIEPEKPSKPEVKDIFPEIAKESTTLDLSGKSEYEINILIDAYVNENWSKGLSFFDNVHEQLKMYSGAGGLKEAPKTLEAMTEFYTPEIVVEKMWGLADKYKRYSIESVCEPSVGVGAFFNPKYVLQSVNTKTAYEFNRTSARITKILYPETIITTEADIQFSEDMKFEAVFTKNRDSVRSKIPTPKHDLVIGNPPYMAVGGLTMGMGEGSYTHARNYIDYFIFRGLDLLKKDGLLIYIVGAEPATGGTLWLDQQDSRCKQMIAAKGKLIDAYRLPEDVFERTKVISDIIVIRKK